MIQELLHAVIGASPSNSTLYADIAVLLPVISCGAFCIAAKVQFLFSSAPSSSPFPAFFSPPAWRVCHYQHFLSTPISFLFCLPLRLFPSVVCIIFCAATTNSHSMIPATVWSWIFISISFHVFISGILFFSALFAFTHFLLCAICIALAGRLIVFITYIFPRW